MEEGVMVEREEGATEGRVEVVAEVEGLEGEEEEEMVVEVVLGVQSGRGAGSAWLGSGMHGMRASRWTLGCQCSSCRRGLETHALLASTPL